MQEKNHADVKFLLLSLASYANVKGIRGLAEFLHTTESKLYSWIHRKSIGDTGLILSKFPEVRPEWLKSGEGEMLKSSVFEPEELYGYLSEPQQKVVQLMKDNPEKAWEIYALILERVGARKGRD